MTILPHHSTRHRLAVTLLTADERRKYSNAIITLSDFRNLEFQAREFKQGVCDGGGFYCWERGKGVATWRENYYAAASIILNNEQLRDTLNEVIT